MDPRDALRRWLPHLVLLAAGAGALALLLTLLAPLAPALITGAALALLCQPLIAERVARRLPRCDPELRDLIAAAVATALPLLLLATTAVALLWTALGAFDLTLGTLLGVLRQDDDAIATAAAATGERVDAAQQLYRWLPVDGAAARAWITSALGGGLPAEAFLARTVGHSGGAALELALIAAVQFALLAQGARLGTWLRSWLAAEDAALVATRYRALAHHLTTVTLGHALAQGALLALAAWAIGDFHPVLIGTVAVALGLLPFVGHLAVWGPLAGLLLLQGRPVAAALLAFAGCAIAAGLWWYERRLALRRDTAALWLGTLTFLALAGGLITCGWRGLVIGPAAVLLVAVLGEALRRHYGRDT